MKNFIYLFLAAIIFFSVNSKNLYADTPHFIDFTKVLNESLAGAEAQTLLKTKLNKSVKKFQKLEINLKNEEKDIINQKKLITNEEYQKKVQAFEIF